MAWPVLATDCLPYAASMISARPDGLRQKMRIRMKIVVSVGAISLICTAATAGDQSIDGGTSTDKPALEAIYCASQSLSPSRWRYRETEWTGDPVADVPLESLSHLLSSSIASTSSDMKRAHAECE